MVEGSSQSVARPIFQMAVPMLLAHDVSPTAGYYAEVKTWFAALKPNLIDRDDEFQAGDGYRELIWLLEPETSEFYRKDANRFEEVMCHQMIALWTLWTEREGDTAERDYWLDYLLLDYIPKWISRGFVVESPMTEGIAHGRVASALTSWCLYLLTSNAHYLERADTYWSLFVSECELLDVAIGAETGILWNHSPNAPNDFPQATNYARYSVTSLYLLHYLSYPNASQALIDKVTVTIRENVMNNGAVSFADFIDGTGTALNGQIAQSAFWLYAKYDNTGAIAEISALLNTAMDGDVQRRLFIPACMVAAGL